MDPVLLNKTAERLKDRNIRINPCFLNKLGLVKTKTFLAVEKYTINCVPVDLSITSARVVAVLGPKELDFFKQYVGTHHKLHMSFVNPLFSKEINLFVNVVLASMVLHNEASRYCLLELSFLRLPNDFKEILVTFLLDLEKTESFYQDESSSAVVLPRKALRSQGIEDRMGLISGDDLQAELQIIELSVRKVQLYGELDFRDKLKEGNTVELEYSNGGICSLINGKITEIRNSDEIEGFFFVTVELEYAPSLCELIMENMPA